jgi:hypothetical protein
MTGIANGGATSDVRMVLTLMLRAGLDERSAARELDMGRPSHRD